jgi:hypothetical protein
MSSLGHTLLSFFGLTLAVNKLTMDSEFKTIHLSVTKFMVANVVFWSYYVVLLKSDFNINKPVSKASLFKV